MPLALCPQVVSQAPQHFRSSEKQAICEGCFARQSICSTISRHSGMSGAVHPPEHPRNTCNYIIINVWTHENITDWNGWSCSSGCWLCLTEVRPPESPARDKEVKGLIRSLFTMCTGYLLYAGKERTRKKREKLNRPRRYRQSQDKLYLQSAKRTRKRKEKKSWLDLDIGIDIRKTGGIYKVQILPYTSFFSNNRQLSSWLDIWFHFFCRLFLE